MLNFTGFPDHLPIPTIFLFKATKHTTVKKSSHLPRRKIRRPQTRQTTHSRRFFQQGAGKLAERRPTWLTCSAS